MGIRPNRPKPVARLRRKDIAAAPDLALKEHKMLKRLHMSRRTFLKASAIGVAGLAVAGYLYRDRFLNDGNPSSSAKDVIRGQSLPIPNLLTGEEIDGKRVYDLTLQIGSMA